MDREGEGEARTSLWTPLSSGKFFLLFDGAQRTSFLTEAKLRDSSSRRANG